MSFTWLKNENPPTFFSFKAWRACPFQYIANGLYDRLCCICLRCRAFCQQIGVILAGGVQQAKRSGEELRVQGFEFYSQFRYLYIKRRNRNLRRDT